jgi:hypothetical protein
MNPEAHDILRILAPPTRLVAWLERMFEAKRNKTPPEMPPDEWIRWLWRWDEIRQGLPAVTDNMTPEAWDAIREAVQPTLLDVEDSKKKTGAY